MTHRVLLSVIALSMAVAVGITACGETAGVGDAPPDAAVIGDGAVPLPDGALADAREAGADAADATPDQDVPPVVCGSETEVPVGSCFPARRCASAECIGGFAYACNPGTRPDIANCKAATGVGGQSTWCCPPMCVRNGDCAGGKTFLCPAEQDDAGANHVLAQPAAGCVFESFTISSGTVPVGQARYCCP